jgi:hypothetical protein
LDPPIFAHAPNKQDKAHAGEGGESAAVVPLMVMSTTIGAFQSASPKKQVLQSGAAVTWAALEPEVQMVVAVDSEEDSAPGGLQRVLCNSNPHGTPYISAMLEHTVKKATAIGARFAGYGCSPLYHGCCHQP